MPDTEKTLVECPACYGSGYQPCGYCGAEDMEQCEECDGNGEIEGEAETDA